MNQARRVGVLTFAALLMVATMGLAGCSGTSDMNGEYMFMVDLTEDRGTMPEEEIFVFVDLMQSEDGYLTGQGYAGYGSNEYEVKVTEGQVSSDGRLYLELYGYDNDDIFTFELYGEEGGSLEGTAEGNIYFDGDERAAAADPVSFVGNAE